MGIEKSWNSDVGTATLNPQPAFPELYYPLWWYSGNVASYGSNAIQYLQKGSLSTTSTSKTLYTHSSGWSPNTQFAIEATLYSSGSSYSTVQLWDITANQAVISISSNSTTATVIRSSKVSMSYLTAGHQYGITLTSSTGSMNVYATDASLIIFPQAPLTSPSVSSISLANASGNTLKESYIPLWVYSSGTVSSTTVYTGASGLFLQKGTTSLNGGGSSCELYTVSNSWNASQQFVLEVSMYSSSSSYNAIVYLFDMSNSTYVTISNVSTASTTATILRSNKFTLIKGHQYGVFLGVGSSGGTAYLSKAHLVALVP